MQPDLVALSAARVGTAPIYVIRGERMVLDQDLARLP